jgi:hypothetical protein
MVEALCYGGWGGAWVKGGDWLGWMRGTSLLIPHRAWLSGDPVYSSFFCTAHKSATVHLTGRMGLAVHWTPLCLERLLSYYYWHSCVVVNVSKGLSPEIEMGCVLTEL